MCVCVGGGSGFFDFSCAVRVLLLSAAGVEKVVVGQVYFANPRRVRFCFLYIRPAVIYCSLDRKPLRVSGIKNGPKIMFFA